MSESVSRFYDDIAEVYRYIFPDWRASARRQGKTIDAILEAHGFLPARHTLYDCTCGIGTQVFGLAECGWKVHGTDLSPKAIEKARQYAPEFDMIFPPTFDVLDLLNPREKSTQYDVVVSLDNAVPHFMTDADLITGLTTMVDHLKDNGLLLIGIRDYDALIENPPYTTMPSVSDAGDGRHIIFQTWDWADNLSSYRLNFYVTRHIGDKITTQCFPSEYRALKRETLSEALTNVGLRDIQWFSPEETGSYQPIVTARKR